MGCFGLDLWVYNNKIALDSIYYLNVGTRIYCILGDISGVYRKRKDVIALRLSFINRALNNSTPTDHTFLIKYDLAGNEFTDIRMFFDK